MVERIQTTGALAHSHVVAAVLANLHTCAGTRAAVSGECSRPRAHRTRTGLDRPADRTRQTSYIFMTGRTRTRPFGLF
jgi:hypothetical protein